MTILEVYEKYKHLDRELNDTDWLPGEVLSKIIVDLWEAIKVRGELDAAAERVAMKLTPPEHIERPPESMDGFWVRSDQK